MFLGRKHLNRQLLKYVPCAPRQGKMPPHQFRLSIHRDHPLCVFAYGHSITTQQKGDYAALKKKKKVKIARQCPALCDPMDCPWNSQVRILEWVTSPFSRGSSQPKDQTQVFRIAADSLLAEPQGKLTNTVVGLPSPEDLPEPGSPALQADSLPTELSGKPNAANMKELNTYCEFFFFFGCACGISVPPPEIQPGPLQ